MSGDTVFSLDARAQPPEHPKGHSVVEHRHRLLMHKGKNERKEDTVKANVTQVSHR